MLDIDLGPNRVLAYVVRSLLALIGYQTAMTIIHYLDCPQYFVRYRRQV